MQAGLLRGRRFERSAQQHFGIWASLLMSVYLRKRQRANGNALTRKGARRDENSLMGVRMETPRPRGMFSWLMTFRCQPRRRRPPWKPGWTPMTPWTCTTPRETARLGIRSLLGTLYGSRCQTFLG